MLPERAILPITPEPGSTRSRFSSKTTVRPSRCTVGPLFMAVLPAVTTLRPLLPPSEEPMASVMTRSGNSMKNWSFTGAENSAADDTTANRDERSYSSSAWASCQPFHERLAHGVPGDHHRVDTLLADEPPDLVRVEAGHEHDLGADEALTHDAPLRGAVHERRHRQVHHGAPGPLPRHHGRVGDPFVRHRVRAAAERVEDVLVPPDHPLGHARGAAGIEDVEVVARAGPEVARLGLPHERRLVLQGSGRRLGVAAVLDDQQVFQPGQLGLQRGDER